MANMHEIGSHKTNIRSEEGQTIVRYHNTDVVKFNCCVIDLNTGGWDTATTKVRMNQTSNQFNLGFKVFQKDYQWFARITYPAICIAKVTYGSSCITVERFDGNRLSFPRPSTRGCNHEG